MVSFLVVYGSGQGQTAKVVEYGADVAAFVGGRLGIASPGTGEHEGDE